MFKNLAVEKSYCRYKCEDNVIPRQFIYILDETLLPFDAFTLSLFRIVQPIFESFLSVTTHLTQHTGVVGGSRMIIKIVR